MAAPAAAAASGLPTDPDGTLQAFYDTMIPGSKVPGLKTELGHAIHPKAIAGVDPEPGAVYTDALLLGKNPKLGFELLAPAFLAELETRALAQGAIADGALFLSLDYEHRQAVCVGGLAFSNPTRLVWEAAAAVAFTAFCAAATIVNADGRPGRPNRAAGYRGHGPSGNRASRLPGLLVRPPPRPGPDARTGPCRDASASTSASSARGSAARSPPGGWRSSTARPARSRASSSSSAGFARATRTSASRWTSTTSPTPTRSPGPGRAGRDREPRRRRVEPVPRRVAAGSARDLRAHRRPAATTAPAGGCGRSRVSRAVARPLLRARRAGLRVAPTTWDMVSKSGGVWAAMLREAGHTCDRVPLAISPERCVNAKWCYTGCIFGAKNSLITNYLASARARRAWRCARWSR